ncbi:CoA transferase [Sulfitobacter sp. F26169L]|uniref:CaiB/BaiF CoA transferase family protein n=1 Tax=Sulfitobacter sp. F26169L TaxID=2996015 RepID=UPI002260A0D3|nr:CoA transferase [Sulfitobacter sp. F26169L]MCX7568106.1 CoA transferase [Sulfitobacter sp. F26169L]
MSSPVSAFPAYAGPADAQGPLSGLRVVDFTHFIAGPFCSMSLGDMGAEVIKVEAPEGEAFRKYGAPRPELDNQGAAFLWANRNKKGVALDLKCAEGAAVARDLVRTADVVIENFSAGVMARFGLGEELLRREQPDLIYCAISAYGQSGPFADRLGFDPVVQAESGFMSLNGDADQAGMRTQPVIMDIATGMMATNAILAALLSRGISGKGQRVDISLYDTALTMLGWAPMQYLVSGNAPQRAGNASADSAPGGVFYASDLPFFISSPSSTIFRRIAQAVGLDDMADDADLLDTPKRVARRKEVETALQEKFSAHPWAYWEPVLRANNVPAGRVQTLAEALHSDVARASGVISQIPHPTAGHVPNIALPLRFSDTPTVAPVAAPAIGADTEAVLLTLEGYDAARLDALRRAGAFGAAQGDPA